MGFWLPSPISVSYNAKEFFSSQCNSSWLFRAQIISLVVCTHDHKIVLRSRNIVFDTARTLLISAHASFKIWGIALLIVCCLINYKSFSILDNVIRHFSCFIRTSCMLFLFECLDPLILFMIYHLVAKDCMHGLSSECVFSGYSRVQRGYQCYFPSTHPFYISAHVTLFEDTCDTSYIWFCKRC